MELWHHARDVLSGRIAHLNQTDAKAIGEIWKNIETLHDPEKIILKHLSVSGSLLVEWLVSRPSESTRRTLPVDVKNLSLNTFRQIHSLVLSYLTFMFYAQYSALEDNLKRALFQSVTDKTGAEKALALFDKVRLPDAPGAARWQEGLEITVWQEMAALVGLDAKTTLPASMLLTGYATTLYNSAVSRIRTDVGL